MTQPLGLFQPTWTFWPIWTISAIADMIILILKECTSQEMQTLFKEFTKGNFWSAWVVLVQESLIISNHTDTLSLYSYKNDWFISYVTLLSIQELSPLTSTMCTINFHAYSNACLLKNLLFWTMISIKSCQDLQHARDSEWENGGSEKFNLSSLKARMLLWMLEHRWTYLHQSLVWKNQPNLKCFNP